MNKCLKNIVYFTILFFVILLADIYVKLNLSAIPYRFITKPFVMLSLITYYLINNKETSGKKFKFMIIALVVYLIGDLFLILYDFIFFYICGLLLFIIGKLLYAFRFSNQRDFNLIKLIPFLVACFIYMIFIMFLVLNNLKAFFIPTMLYLFASMIVALFAILRKGAVNRKSYNLVLMGILFAIICDSISVLQSFYNENIAYQEITIMLTYGVSQYFIVTGIVAETKTAITV